MGRTYAMMRALKFLVKCELERDGPSKAGQEVLELLEKEIEADEADAAVLAASTRPFVRPKERPPVFEGREKEDGDEEAAEG